MFIKTAIVVTILALTANAIALQAGTTVALTETTVAAQATAAPQSRRSRIPHNCNTRRCKLQWCVHRIEDLQQI